MGKRSRSIIAGLFAILGMTLFGWGSVGAANSQQIRALHNDGQRLLNQARFREAIGVFADMLAACGNDEYCQGVAKFYLGRSHLEVSEFDLADEFLKDAGNLFSRLNRPAEKAKVLHVQGRLLTAKTAYEQAISAFDQSASVLAQQGGREDEELFGVRMDRAEAQIRLYQYDKAENDLNEAERLIKGGKDPRKMGALLQARGLMYHQRQEYDKALKNLNEALKYFESAGDRKMQALVLTVIGHVYESRAQYNEALARYKRSLELAGQVGDPAAQAFAYNNLGSVNWKRGNYSAALKHYTAALDIRERLGIPRFRANQLNNIGLISLAYGDYAKAFSMFEQSRQIAKEVGAKEVEAWALHDEAWVMKEQGRFIEALKASEQAIELAEQIKDRRLQATAILRLGNLYEHYGNFDEAEKHYRQAIQIQVDIGDRLFESNTLGDLANVLTRKGTAKDIREAENNYQKATTVKREIGVPLGELLCKFALFYLEQGKYYDSSGLKDADSKANLEKADERIREAEAVIKQQELEDFMLLTYVQGRYLLDVQPQEALTRFAKLQAQAESSQSLKYRFLALVGLGLANERLKRLPEAEKAYEQAVTVSEEIRNTLDPEARRTFLHGEEVLGVKHLVPYEGLARVRWQSKNWPGSWKASEWAKARAFGEKLARRIGSATYGVDRELLDELTGLEERIGATYKQLNLCTARNGDRSTLPELRRTRETLSKKYKALLQTIRQKEPKFYQVRFPEPIPLGDAEIKEGEWVLAYQVTDTGVLAYLAEGKSIRKVDFKSIDRQELYALIRKFRRPLTVDPRTFLQGLKAFDFDAGKRLASLLLADVLDAVPQNQPITIVPDALLGIVPFEALVLGGSGEVKTDGLYPSIDPKQVQFLGDRNPVSYSQSVTALTLARRAAKERRQGKRLLAMVDPIFSLNDSRAKAATKRGLGDLPAGITAPGKKNKSGAAVMLNSPTDPAESGKRTAKELSEKMPRDVVTLMMSEEDESRLKETEKLGDFLKQAYGPSVDLYRGGDARKSLFLDTNRDLTVYRSMVFATHGKADGYPEIPEPVILLTLVDQSEGIDGLLRMSEVMSLKMNPDLVALTACDTGLGGDLSGEGTMSMGRAFQYGGAGAVLMTLWSVQVDASVELAEAFFKSRKEGKTNLEALREARAAIRKNGYEHPFFWAPFILVGEDGTR